MDFVNTVWLKERASINICLTSEQRLIAYIVQAEDLMGSVTIMDNVTIKEDHIDPVTIIGSVSILEDLMGPVIIIGSVTIMEDLMGLVIITGSVTIMGDLIGLIKGFVTINKLCTSWVL